MAQAADKHLGGNSWALRNVRPGIYFLRNGLCGISKEVPGLFLGLIGSADSLFCVVFSAGRGGAEVPCSNSELQHSDLSSFSGDGLGFCLYILFCFVFVIIRTDY